MLPCGVSLRLPNRIRERREDLPSWSLAPYCRLILAEPSGKISDTTEASCVPHRLVALNAIVLCATSFRTLTPRATEGKDEIGS